MKRKFVLALAGVGLAGAVGCQGPGPGHETAQTSTEADGALTAGATGVYEDALASGWTDWSWATRNLANASPVASGTRSISVNFGPWTGLYLHNAGVSTANLATLDFKVNGGATAGAALNAYLTKGGSGGTTVSVAKYCTGGTIPANAWTSCSIPLSAMGGANSTIDGVVLQEGAGKTLPALYVDSIQLTPASTGGTTPPPSGGATAWIYRDAVTSPWTDASWATRNLANTSPVAAGTRSASATMGAWQALAFSASGGFSTAGHSTLSLQVNGGASNNPTLLVRAQVNGAWTAGTALGPTCAGGAVKANAWTRCNVPLSAIAPAGATVTSLAIQEGKGTNLPVMYFDEIGVDVPTGTTTGSTTGATTTGTTTTGGTTGGTTTGGTIGGTTTGGTTTGGTTSTGTTSAGTGGSTGGSTTGSTTPPPSTGGKESWVWLYTDYSNTLNSVIANKASFTHVSPTFYTVNYSYTSGVPYYTTCPTSGGYNCSGNGSNNFSGLTTKAFTDKAKAAGLQVVPAIYGGAGNGGTDTGIQNLLNNTNGAGDNFITALTNEAVANGYAGYNIDWETGGGVGSAYADKFVAFVNKFKAALAPHGMSLSVDAIVSDINGTYCSSNNGFLDLPKLNASSVDAVIIEDYVNTLGTATTSCQSRPLSSSNPISCDFTLTGELNMMCSPNLSMDKAIIGLEADPGATNPIAGQAFSTIKSYGFTKVAVWPQAPFMTNSNINPAGTTWYTLLKNFLQ